MTIDIINIVRLLFFIGVFSVISILLFGLTLTFSIVYVVYFIEKTETWKDWFKNLGGNILNIAVLTLTITPFILVAIDVTQLKFINDTSLEFIIGIIWQFYFLIVIIILLVVYPAIFFIYTAERPTKFSFLFQAFWGIISPLSALIIFIPIAAVIWVVFGWTSLHPTANNQFEHYQLNSSTLGHLSYSTDYSKILEINRPPNDIIKKGETLLVSPACFFGSIPIAVGSIIASIFGGWGLFTLFIYCFQEFRNRPKKTSAKDFLTQKVLVIKKTKKLIDFGIQLEDKRVKGTIGPNGGELLREFQKQTLQLEEDWKKLDIGFHTAGGSIILPYIKLIFGVFSFFISIFVVVHLIVVLFNDFLVQYNTTINDILVKYLHINLGVVPSIDSALQLLDSQLFDGFPLFGIIIMIGFGFYFMICIIIGSFQLIDWIPLLNFTKMRKKDTLVNNMILNTFIILLSSLGILQILVYSCASYLKGSVIDGIFNYLLGNPIVSTINVTLLLYSVITGKSSPELFKEKNFFFQFLTIIKVFFRLPSIWITLIFSILGFGLTLFKVLLWNNRSQKEKEINEIAKRLEGKSKSFIKRILRKIFWFVFKF